MNAVECTNLFKQYSGTTALDHINLNLTEGKIYGLLGPNGAGKTTLLKIISGQIMANEGQIFLMGKDISKHPIDDLIFYVREYSEYYKDVRIKDLFELTKVIKPSWNDEIKNQLLNSFDIPLKKKFQQLSKGQQSMVNIILGLSSMTPITIFDESYLGLDAIHRHNFFEILRSHYAEYNRTFILSTHYIEEVSNLFEEIVLINKGQIVGKHNKDDIENLAYELIGSKDQLNKHFRKGEILNTEPFGSKLKCAIEANISNEKLLEIRNDNIEIHKLSLEKWFIYKMKGVAQNDEKIY